LNSLPGVLWHRDLYLTDSVETAPLATAHPMAPSRLNLTDGTRAHVFAHHNNETNL